MSVRAISWAYGQNLGSASQKAVLLHLAYLAREEDNCAWPHVTRIQAETELSERTVHKALKALQDKGLIALGDQNLAAGHGNGDIVPANRRPKVWILRLDHSGKADSPREAARLVEDAWFAAIKGSSLEPNAYATAKAR